MVQVLQGIPPNHVLTLGEKGKNKENRDLLFLTILITSLNVNRKGNDNLNKVMVISFSFTSPGEDTSG